MDQAEELKACFKLICRKCGSENVVVDINEIIDYGGETGISGGSVSFGCNDCKQNDYFLSL